MLCTDIIGVILPFCEFREKSNLVKTCREYMNGYWNKYKLSINWTDSSTYISVERSQHELPTLSEFPKCLEMARKLHNSAISIRIKYPKFHFFEIEKAAIRNCPLVYVEVTNLESLDIDCLYHARHITVSRPFSRESFHVFKKFKDLQYLTLITDTLGESKEYYDLSDISVGRLCLSSFWSKDRFKLGPIKHLRAFAWPSMCDYELCRLTLKSIRISFVFTGMSRIDLSQFSNLEEVTINVCNVELSMDLPMSIKRFTYGGFSFPELHTKESPNYEFVKFIDVIWSPNQVEAINRFASRHPNLRKIDNGHYVRK
jgi:hypothetical protein